MLRTSDAARSHPAALQPSDLIHEPEALVAVEPAYFPHHPPERPPISQAIEPEHTANLQQRIELATTNTPQADNPVA
ncbi:hypothetical protein JDS79_36455, partial [Bacillus cereus]|nr:hypothetical protein [Bacillus cereus]